MSKASSSPDYLALSRASWEEVLASENVSAVENKGRGIDNEMTIDVFIVEAITPDSTGVETLSSLEVGSPRGNRGMTSLVLGTTFLILEVDVEVPPF